QVGPPRYCRQANSVSFQPPHFHEAIRTNLGTSLKISLKTPSVFPQNNSICWLPKKTAARFLLTCRR
ncbi:hypothetical protein N7583_23740, partial [Serratia marcescens]|uniref:hypothetical protein n=1 Tax=Serratia marcescens TaxID=615 RepID=UPI002881D9C3